MKNNALSRLVRHYLPYWPLFVLLFLVMTAAGWLYLKVRAPLYASTARILIKNEKTQPESTHELDPLSPNKVVENEVEIIQSRTLLGQVTEDLGLYAPVYREGRFGPRIVYTGSPIHVIAADPDSIRAVKKIFFQVQANNMVRLNGIGDYPWDEWVRTPYGKLRFTRGAAADTTGGNERFYFNLEDPRDVVTMLRGRMKVETKDKLSSILDLTLQDEVPRRGEDILNDLMRVYADAILRNKDLLATNTLAFVDEQLGSVRRELDSIETVNRNYKSAQGAVDLGEQGKLYLQGVSLDDQKINDINMQLSVLDETEKHVRTIDSAHGMAPSLGDVHDPVLMDRLNKLYSEQLEYESRKTTTGVNDAGMRAIADRIARMKPSILENIHSQKASLLAARADLEKISQTYLAALQQIPGKQKSLTDIDREQAVKSAIYSFLLQKKEETAIAHASTVSDVRVIDRAESAASPVSPNKKVIYITALLLAAGLGMGIVAAKESLTRKIMFRHEIELLTEIPIIGEISYQRKTEAIVIGAGQKTFIAEQFRKLRTSLKLIGVSTLKKRILVTSSMAGEGKSFIASNLATAIAMTGKKVVLIDGDLHSPSLHFRLGLQPSPGLAEYLQDEAGHTHDILQKAGNEGRFAFIAAGRLPEDPSELIMNGRIEKLLEQLETEFDCIVLDTAPAMPVTDAYILSACCDSTLFVVRHQYTPKIFLQKVAEDHKLHQLKNIGIVFNGIQPRGFGKENYGLGYGYGYVYNNKTIAGRPTGQQQLPTAVKPV